MKVAIVIQHADPDRGGAERSTVDLAAALVQRGLDVRLLASSFGPDVPQRQQVLLASHGRSRLGRYRSMLDALDEHLQQQRYDVVHAMMPVRRCDIYNPRAGIAAEALASGHEKHTGRIRRVLARLANQYLNPVRRYYAAVERECLMREDRPAILVCQSDYIRQQALRHYDLPAQRTRVIFNAVRPERLDPILHQGAGEALRQRLGIARDRVVALFISQDFARKGLARAIEALDGVRKAGSNRPLLLVVGREPVGVYRRLARRLNLEADVLFAGGTDDPAPFYMAADFLVLPTTHDPASRVVLEALVMGLPVITTTQNGASEIMRQHQHGVILDDPHDIPALVSAMRELLNPDARQRMRECCLALRPQLSYRRLLDELVELYQQLAPTP